MKNINRRRFLKTSFVSTAALTLPLSSWSQVKGANSDIRVAIVGFNAQGKNDLEEFRKVPGVRVVALCDVDKEILEREAKKFQLVSARPRAFGEQFEAALAHLGVLLVGEQFDAIVERPHRREEVMAQAATQQARKIDGIHGAN